jgi:hypothetical protein
MIADLSLFVGLIFAAMLLIVLAPADNGRLVVVLGKNQDVSSIYSVLSGTRGTLVEQIGDRTFVVESDEEGFTSALYRRGAFLVLSGTASYGCNAEIDTNPYRRNIGTTYAQGNTQRNTGKNNEFD